MSVLLYAIGDNGVATITLNRPERLNAFTHEMIELWVDALRDAQRNEAVQVVVVTGAGRAFCAGGDVGGMNDAQRALEATAEDGLGRDVDRVDRAAVGRDERGDLRLDVGWRDGQLEVEPGGGVGGPGAGPARGRQDCHARTWW